MPAPAKLEQLLAAKVDAAQRALPQVQLRREAFIAFLAQRLGTSRDAVDRLPERDLFLAWACGEGDRAAIRIVDDQLLAGAEQTLVQMKFSPALAADVHQKLAEKLLVPVDGRARICDYQGRGDLKSWVQIAAVRLALQALRPAKREESGEDPWDELPSTADDPELSYYKTVYSEDFRAAFRQALGELEPRERMVLKMQYLDGLTIDELGKAYRVHRTTAARWAAKAKHEVQVLTRKKLIARLGISRSEATQMMALLSSRLDVSLRRLLDG